VSSTSEARELKQEVKKLSTLISDRLVEEIQNGTRLPGERLIQNDLAERFGVSRVAIRDALMELRQRGLSVNVPLKGDIVRPVSCKHIADVFALREVVEAFAVRTAVSRIDAAGLSRLASMQREQETHTDKGDLEFLLDADWRFHSTIFSYCDNEPLLDVITSLWARIRQARSVAKINESWGHEWSAHSARRHKSLLAAIERRDADAASSITAENIRSAAAELIGQLRAQGWDEAAPAV
jgi:DNA-binding GntR family transcriptional regulator